MATKEVGNSGEWIKASEYLPAPYESFGGAELSREVVVLYESGEQGTNNVHFPHGAFGSDMKAGFCPKNGIDAEDKVEYWLDYIIPEPPEV